MSARHLLSVFRVDNGFLIEYKTGDKATGQTMLGGKVEFDATGTRICLDAEEVGRTVSAMLDTMVRKPGFVASLEGE